MNQIAQQRAGGITATVVVHATIVGLALFTYDFGCESSMTPALSDDSVVIEAALAFKSAPKQRLPQKEKLQMVAPPDAPKVAPEDEIVPPPKPPEEKEPPKPEEIDPESVLDKNRPQDPDLGKTGSDEALPVGNSEGSEWGTEVDAKGHPYVGELRGRIEAAWNHPATDREGGNVLGCVKLDTTGRIVDRTVGSSPNSTLNRSVYLALKNASDMDQPVPDDIQKLLTERGICFNFNPDM